MVGAIAWKSISLTRKVYLHRHSGPSNLQIKWTRDDLTVADYFFIEIYLEIKFPIQCLVLQSGDMLLK